MCAVVLIALFAPCSEAWVVVPPRGCSRSARRWSQQLPCESGARSRRQPPPPPPPLPPSSRQTPPPAVSQSADNQAEGTTPPPLPLSLERSPTAAAEAGGSKASRRSVSWQERFASLRNDMADPWTFADQDSNSEHAPAASLETSADKDGGSSVPHQAATDGGASVGEGLADVESPLAAAAAAAVAITATSVPGETEPTPPATSTPPRPGQRSPPARPRGSVAEEAAALMSSRGESDAAAAHRAYLLLDAELAGAQEPLPPSSSPPVSELRRSTAEALLSWVRSSTAGNGLVVDDGGKVATADTEERRKLWAEHAPRVLQLVKDIGKEPSSDPVLQQIYTEATMYSVSSQGILEAFVSGKALAFTSAMTVLVNKFPTQDNGVAFIFQGSYYLAAPWPIRSARKALACYEKAVKINGRSRRNVYYAGLGRMACGDRRGAREMFSRAVSDEHCESVTLTEKDIAASIREQAQRGLNVCG